MAKRFTIVGVGEDSEFFYPGYMGIEELPEAESVLEELMNYSALEKVSVVISHCLLLDFPEPDEDISDEELDILLDSYEDLVDEGYIYLDEVAELELDGLQEEEVIEEVVSK